MKIEKAVALISGGIDSPVAVQKVKEFGIEVVGVTFHYVPLANEDSIEKTKKLSKMVGIKKLYVIPFAEAQAEVVRKTEHRKFFIITRRIMWRVAEEIAKKEKVQALVTGENLAQVASQTLQNMKVTDDVVELPILRPLLGFDKLDIIKIARKLGTYEVSKGPELCCMLGPKHPETASRIDMIEREEEKLDVDKMVKELLEKAEIVELN